MKRQILILLLLWTSLSLTAQLTVENDSLKSRFGEDVSLPEVTVTARTKNIDSRGLGNMRINMQQLRQSPLFLGERDIVKTLQFLPGVSPGMEGSSQLNIRGGTGDQTLYLMDDVPVYNQNHTFGFFSVFNSDALQSADLYKGGIPSLYGDRLSGVASIALKDGDYKKRKHSLSLGLLAGTLASEGPVLKDKLSYLVTARRSFVDLLYNGVMSLAGNGDGGGVMIGFYDINGKLSWKINPKSKLSWQIYSGYDDLYGMNKENKDYTGDKYSEKFGFGWKTLMSSLRFTSDLKPGLFLSSSLYYTQLNNFNYFKNKDIRDRIESSLENNISSLLHEAGLRNSLEHKLNDAHTLFYGLSLTGQIYTPNYLEKKINGSKLVYDTRDLKLYTASGYIYDEYRYKDWLFSAGLRASVYNNTRKTVFAVEPRIKANKYLGDRNKLMLAYDVMHQPVHSINEMSYNVQTDFWVPFREDVLPHSRQISFGWKNHTTSNLSLTVEVYYKKMNHLLSIKNLENYMDFHTDFETGEGSSTGLELMAEYSKNKLTAWASYTLSKSNRRFSEKTHPFKYDAPHDFSGFVGYKAYKSKKTVNTLSMSVQYKSGYPYYVPEITYPSAGMPTMDNAYSALNDISTVDFIPDYPNIRLKNYFRTDLNFTMEQKLKHGERIWQFSILNLTAHQNPYVIYRKNDRYKAFMLIPFLPSLSFTRVF